MKYLELVLAAYVGLAVGASNTGAHHFVNATNTLEVRSAQNSGGPAKSFWAQDEPLFTQCEKQLLGNPCVMELFHLQWSVEEFRKNCDTGDLSHNRTVRVGAGSDNFPTHLFPEGPSCGKVEDGFLVLKPGDYLLVCGCVQK